MKLVTFEVEGKTGIGALVDGKIANLSDLAPNMVDFLAGGEALLAKARERAKVKASLPLEKVRLKAPILKPNKIMCIGLNYADHAAEQGLKPPEQPVLFAKYWTSIIGTGESIVLPKESQQVDYEAELGVVIGKRAKGVSESEAMKYVAGYLNAHDVSARDFQFKDGQWIRGKSCDTFFPIGPFLLTADEVSDPHVLNIQCRVGGETLQNSNTRNLIFKIPYLVHYYSQAMTLEPGDIISTGTPPGVGVFRKPPRFLKAGEVVEIEVQGLGVLRNMVAAE